MWRFEMRPFLCALGALCVMFVGCTPLPVVPVGSDEDTPAPNGWVEIWAQSPIGEEAELTVELLERENQVGQIGWHVHETFDGEVDFRERGDDLQAQLDDDSYNVIVDNVECVRYNVNYFVDGDAVRWLCEGNDHTANEAQLITQTEFTWMGNSWDVGTWSEPASNPDEGCSALACR